jgi:hypothetical protein
MRLPDRSTPVNHSKQEVMDDRLAKSLQERTDAKLRYARIHLDELKAQGPPDGGDFDRAQQESFLFHLLGTADAFLTELCHYYRIVVPGAVSPGKIRAALKARGMSSLELRALHELEQDPTSWYSQAKDMRNHSTHIQGVGRAYFLGGENHQKVKLKHPSTGVLTDDHFILEFENWTNLMESLVFSLRKSALERMNE